MKRTRRQKEWKSWIAVLISILISSGLMIPVAAEEAVIAESDFSDSAESAADGSDEWSVTGGSETEPAAATETEPAEAGLEADLMIIDPEAEDTQSEASDLPDAEAEFSETAPAEAVPENGLISIESIEVESEALPPSDEERALLPALLAGPIDASSGAPNPVSDSGVSTNRNAQSYSRWASPVNSYLAAEGDGFLRVEYCGGQILVEHYDSSFILQSQSSVSCELSYFGGFFAGSDAYYLVFGQPNTEQNDAKEVVRIVKYDKNWIRLDAASLCGANTTVPFDAGSLRMTEYGGYLYVRTCHKMYTSDDGLNHQANLTIQIRTSDMAITDSFSDIMNIDAGYVSHSFNQFILADDGGNLIALDHGDAYPRSIVLGKYRKKAGESTFTSGYLSYDAVNLLNFKGETGDNATGASIGGLEYSDTSYLAAGSSVRQDENWSGNQVQNIFITSTSRSSFSADGSRLLWVTDYPEGGGYSASTPQMVKLSSDRFLLLWALEQSGSYYNNSTGKICYVFLDGSANVLTPVCTADGYLSDCKPLATENGAVWYVTDGRIMMFCQIDHDGNFHQEPAHLHTYEPEMTFQNSSLECGLIEGSVSNPLTTNSDGSISYFCDDPGIAEVAPDGSVTLKGLGTCTITASASAGVDYRAKSASYTLTVLDLKRQVIQAASSITKTYGDADFSLQASCLGGAPLQYISSDETVAAVSSDGTVSLRSAGTATITILAQRYSDYTGARADVALTVNRIDIQSSGLKLIFSKCGGIPMDTAEQYVLAWDGKKFLRKDIDYDIWIYSFVYDSATGAVLEIVVELDGQGNYTGSVFQTMETISSSPSLYSATLESGGIHLEWEAETSSLGYQIYRRQGKGEYQLVQTLDDSNAGSWIDTAVKKNSGTISYYIKAYTSNGASYVYSDASNTVTVQLSSSQTGDKPSKKNLRSLSNCKVSLSKSKFVYSGKAVKPAVTVKDGSKKLKQDSDYTVTFKNNKKVGKATATVTGKGNYSGSVEKTFQIVKKSQNWKVTISAKKLKVGKTARIKVKKAAGKVSYKSSSKKVASINSKGRIKAIAPGRATITVTAKGNKNCRSATRKFKITMKK